MTQETLREQVELLTARDSKSGYAALQLLQQESEEGAAVYPYLAQFFAMLDSKNSYVRTRGLVLIAANARWDTEEKIDAQLDRYLCHIIDEKPITARQCIKMLPVLAACKPALKAQIVSALQSADISGYGNSMRPLIAKDIESALRQIG